ncbi:SRPBCC domain-containing protein [Sinimarinibacterium flocculans]|uniref:SRPBCC domain-containing protein n=1 Tax=Sinimarinibacterium flocculans TaxID=985250 RepID=UPI002493AE3C|nr:SRPBCC domain-containing protein [Sinimarinibacterium flocculans]
MFTIDRMLEIDAPPEVVWKVLTDFARYGEWNPFVPEARCDLRPGGALEMQVRLRDKPGAKRQFQREWVNSVTPGTTYSYSMKPVPLGALRSERVQTVAALDAGRCRYTSHFELAGWLHPLVTAVLGDGLRKGFEDMAQGLKRQAEAEARR